MKIVTSKGEVGCEKDRHKKEKKTQVERRKKLRPEMNEK